MLKLCVIMFWQIPVRHLSKHLFVLSAVSIDGMSVGWYGLDSIFFFKYSTYKPKKPSVDQTAAET